MKQNEMHGLLYLKNEIKTNNLKIKSEGRTIYK